MVGRRGLYSKENVAEDGGRREEDGHGVGEGGGAYILGNMGQYGEYTR